jgi:hypothetical protein
MTAAGGTNESEMTTYNDLTTKRTSSTHFVESSSRPLIRLEIKLTKQSAKDGPDSIEITSLFHPALDGWRSVRAQTELAQLCFGDLKSQTVDPMYNRV